MSRLERLKKMLIPGALIAAGYFGLHLIGVGCPILFMTGISCPGCGMTRAYLALLRLDLYAAFSFHPLFPLPPILFFLYFLREGERLSRKKYDAAVWVFCGAFLIVWVLRMVFGDGGVVVFTPENGFVLRAIRTIFGEF
ncbi:MAG: DUF2752 domain-containing protein [Bacteroides sp.]|nr:DUF2752 domain-containing protein [Eubacterium sp.]MCM1418768.1 DUF2752 domain-containing protein [Roseburia sp.]MCM1462013.1 DUF2752 domain-containing protein [Bacteroides sp.]